VRVERLQQGQAGQRIRHACLDSGNLDALKKRFSILPTKGLLLLLLSPALGSLAPDESSSPEQESPHSAASKG